MKKKTQLSIISMLLIAIAFFYIRDLLKSENSQYEIIYKFVIVIFFQFLSLFLLIVLTIRNIHDTNRNTLKQIKTFIREKNKRKSNRNKIKY
jgi:uncharacterized membrane protein YhaH (DUF805 family)